MIVRVADIAPEAVDDDAIEPGHDGRGVDA